MYTVVVPYLKSFFFLKKLDKLEIVLLVLSFGHRMGSCWNQVWNVVYIGTPKEQWDSTDNFSLLRYLKSCVEPTDHYINDLLRRKRFQMYYNIKIIHNVPLLIRCANEDQFPRKVPSKGDH